MKWDGRVGPAAVLAFGIAIVQVLGFIGDSRADIGNRLVKLETTMITVADEIRRMRDLNK